MHVDTFLSFSILLILVAANDASPKNCTTAAEVPTRSHEGGRKDDPDPCRKNQHCCKLGRKAARRSYICQFEALSKGLEYETAASHRLQSTATDRKQAALSYLNQAWGFRRRLDHCHDPLNKKCFQYCCKAVRNKKLARAKAKKREDKKGPTQPK